MSTKVKCSNCGCIDYKVINVGTLKKNRVELRQCKKCFRKYKVEIDRNEEKIM